MNQDLASVIKIYSTGKHQDLSRYLVGKSKDALIGMLLDLLTMYITDKNSSTIREFITVTLAGYKHKLGKIGYNGFKQDAFIAGQTFKCEAKPQNIDSSANRKLNGGGNFTDYTFKRLERDKQKSGLNMLMSGFIDGRLIYILEIPFNHPDFVKHLEEQLRRRFKEGKDVSGQFLRSANFDYRYFINSLKLKIIFLLKKKELVKYSQYIVKDFYKFIESKSK